MKNLLSLIILVSLNFHFTDSLYASIPLKCSTPQKDTTIIVYDEFVDNCYHSIRETRTPFVIVDSIYVVESKNIDRVPCPIQGISTLIDSIKYPELAFRAGLEGHLLLTATVDIQGIPRNIKIKRSDAPIFEDACISALSKSKFQPAELIGHLVESKIAISILFRLKGLNIKKINIPIDQIIVYKGPCLGSCPSYTITISSDGTLMYEGHYYVERLGKWKTQLNKYQIKEITSLIYAIGFFKLNESYSNLATCQSWITITVKVGDKIKKVSSDPGCYYPLWSIDSLIEYMTEKSNWEKIKD